jgi:hypothetical protein
MIGSVGFTPGTEVLTSQGWQDCSELTRFSRVASVDLETNTTKFTKAGIRTERFNGELYSAQGALYDLQVPIDQKFVVDKQGKGKNPFYKLMSGAEVFGRCLWLKVSTLVVQEASLEHTLPVAREDERAFWQLVGFWVGRGKVHGTRRPQVVLQWPKTAVAKVSVGAGTQQLGLEIEGLYHNSIYEQLISELPFNIVSKSDRVFEIADPAIAQWLLTYCWSRNRKRLPPDVLALSRENARALIQGIEQAVGFSKSYKGWRFSTKSLELANQIQGLYLLHGRFLTLKPDRCLSMNGPYYSLLDCKKASVQKQSYLRSRYCTETLTPWKGFVSQVATPDGTTIIRRMGKPVICTCSR